MPQDHNIIIDAIQTSTGEYDGENGEVIGTYQKQKTSSTKEQPPNNIVQNVSFNPFAPSELFMQCYMNNFRSSDNEHTQLLQNKIEEMRQNFVKQSSVSSIMANIWKQDGN